MPLRGIGNSPTKAASMSLAHFSHEDLETQVSCIEINKCEYLGLFPMGNLTNTDFICNNTPALLP